MPILPAPPASDPSWIIANPGNGVEPTQPFKDTGWFPSERPPPQYMNWLFYNLTLWVRWAKASILLLNNVASPYDASVGTGGTYADINAAMADVNFVAGMTLVVLNSLALGVTQQITKNNIKIVLKPGVVLSDNGAGTGLQISATKVRIVGGQISGFATNGILIDAASDYSLIGELMLSGNATDIKDNNGKGATYALINL